MADEPESDLVSALQSFVAERDEPCPACRYNLRGLQGRQCPECGLDLRLVVQRDEPAMAAFLATLAALFALGGAGGSVTVIWLMLGAGFGDGGGALVLAPCVAGAFGLALGIGLGTRRGRREFRRRPFAVRIWTAAVAWAAVVVGSLAYGAWVLATLSQL